MNMLVRLLALLAVSVGAFAAPTQVLVTIPAGATPPAGFGETLSAWKFSGQVATIHVLEQNQKDRAGFRTMAILEFPSEGSYEAWRKEGAPKLAAPVAWKHADVMTHAEISPRDSNRSTWIVDSYDPGMSPAAFKELADKTVAPSLYAQREGKALMRYTLYLERDTPNPRAVLVREYRDPISFAKRGEVKGQLKVLAETQAQYVELPPPSLPDLPSYKVEYKVVGGIRMIGSELKNAVEYLAEEFMKFHPDAKVAVSHIPSSEGGIAGLYMGTSDVAPMGDDAKITDLMPFYNTFGYMPTEISVATGGYEKRGSLFAWAIVVNKDNPLNEISMDQLERVFGSERSGGWELVDSIDYKFTSKWARGRDSNIRTWGQLGLTGDFANHEIETFGYAAPGFAVSVERALFHWSKKWNGNFMEYVEVKQTPGDAAGLKVASERPLEALEHNKYAIGIAGLMHAKNYPNLKVLAVSPRGGGPAVALTPENVVHRKYPLIRDGYFYVNKPPGGKLDPKVREFMRFVLSREGQEVIARVGYYYPLEAAYLQDQLKKLD
jgi:phosphate transport system substrate-binding protein